MLRRLLERLQERIERFLRERLSDDLGDEANRAMEFNIKLFDEIANAHNISAT